MPQEKPTTILRPDKGSQHITSTHSHNTHTQHKVTTIRIRDKIKYLYCKKQKLNTLIYKMHLTLVDTRDNLRPYIYHKIEEKIQREIRSSHQTLDKKLNQLTQAQKPPPTTSSTPEW